MAVKALAKISHFTLNAADEFTLTVDIESNGQGVQNVEVGTFVANQASAVINAQIVAFVKQYAIDNMGATFATGDTARLIDGVNLI